MIALPRSNASESAAAVAPARPRGVLRANIAETFRCGPEPSALASAPYSAAERGRRIGATTHNRSAGLPIQAADLPSRPWRPATCLRSPNRQHSCGSSCAGAGLKGSSAALSGGTPACRTPAVSASANDRNGVRAPPETVRPVSTTNPRSAPSRRPLAPAATSRSPARRRARRSRRAGLRGRQRGSQAPGLRRTPDQHRTQHWAHGIQYRSHPARGQAAPMTRPLVGTPVPAVTSTGPSPGTWLTEVPRTCLTASAIPFIPWM